MFPKVSVSALTRHVKHCEGKTAHAGEKTENLLKVKNIRVYVLRSYCLTVDKVQLKSSILLNAKPLPRRLELLYAEANGWYNVLCLGLKRATEKFPRQY